MAAIDKAAQRLSGRLHRHQARQLPRTERQPPLRQSADRQRHRSEAQAGQVMNAPGRPWPVAKPRLATCALTGCFGCHMSLLDIDERLLELVDLVDLDVSPFDDKKAFDRPVDVGFRRRRLLERV
jgi:hypothetical protein